MNDTGYPTQEKDPRERQTKTGKKHRGLQLVFLVCLGHHARGHECCLLIGLQHLAARLLLAVARRCTGAGFVQRAPCQLADRVAVQDSSLRWRASPDSAPSAGPGVYAACACSVYLQYAPAETKGRPSGRHSAKAALFNMLAHRGLVTLGGGPHQRSLAVLVCGGRARSRGEQDAHHLEEGAGAEFGLAAQGMPRGQGRRTVGLGAKGKGMAMGKGMGIRDGVGTALLSASAWPRLAAACSGLHSNWSAASTSAPWP